MFFKYSSFYSPSNASLLRSIWSLCINRFICFYLLSLFITPAGHRICQEFWYLSMESTQSSYKWKRWDELRYRRKYSWTRRNCSLVKWIWSWRREWKIITTTLIRVLWSVILSFFSFIGFSDFTFIAPAYLCIFHLLSTQSYPIHHSVYSLVNCGHTGARRAATTLTKLPVGIFLFFSPPR